MQQENVSLLEEEDVEIEVIDEAKAVEDAQKKYPAWEDDFKKLYWLNKSVVKALRAKNIPNGMARRYANRNTYRILKEAF